jgi:hypothetical protein
MTSNATIRIQHGFCTFSFGFVVAACAAHEGHHPPSPVPSDPSVDAGRDAGTAQDSDTQADSGSTAESDAQADVALALEPDAHVTEASIDITVPIGACLPRKTGGVPAVRSTETRVGYPMEMVEFFVRKGSRVAVDDCVHAARERDPKLQGKVVLHFELPTNGGIKGTSVTRGVGDVPLHECLISALDKSPMPVLRDGGKTFINNYGVVICPDGHTEWPNEGGFR